VTGSAVDAGRAINLTLADPRTALAKFGDYDGAPAAAAGPQELALAAAALDRLRLMGYYDLPLAKLPLGGVCVKRAF